MQFQPSSASELPGPDFLQGLTQAAVLPCFLLDLTSQCPLRQLASVDSPMVRVTALIPGLITPPGTPREGDYCSCYQLRRFWLWPQGFCLELSSETEGGRPRGEATKAEVRQSS